VFILKALGAFFGGGVKLVEDLAEKTWGAVRSVFLFASGIFGAVGEAWDWMVNGLDWLGEQLISALTASWHLLEWLTLHAIPEALRWAVGLAEHEAAVALHLAREAFDATLGAAVKWARHELDALTSWVTSEARRIWATLSTAWNWIETTGKKVGELWLHPERLADWLVASLVIPLLKFLISTAGAVIVWLFKRAATLMPELASTIEDALHDLI
jgi:hypothetical protein